MMELFINLLVLQAIMGAFDTLYHHEFKVALPRCPTAKLELKIHAIRALLYAIVFFGIAWYQWGGAWTVALVGIIVIEVLLTLWDFVIEDATRVLPNSERITHTLLAINGGAAFVLLATELPQWYAMPTAFIPVDYGWQSWFLALGAIGVALSGVRDAFAAWTVQRMDLQLKLDFGGHRRVLMTGGTGFIGSALCRELLSGGHEVTLVSRRPEAAALQFGGKVRAVRSALELSSEEVFDVIINLAGAPVVGLPWSRRRKRELLQSRIHPTQDVIKYVKRVNHAPAVWIQASAVGYYGIDNESELDENAPAGQGFAASLCKRWESMTKVLETRGVRCVVMRFGLVFGRSGGALPMMLMPFRLGLGSIIGNGQQHVSWIHIEDLLRLIAQGIADETLHGKVNAVAPESPTYEEFAKLIGQLLHRPVLMRLPATLLRKSLGEMASLFVDGPRIVPKRLIKNAFEYRFPSLRSALMDLT